MGRNREGVRVSTNRVDCCIKGRGKLGRGFSLPENQ